MREYPQRFKCEINGFDEKTENEVFAWHIRRCPISFLSIIDINRWKYDFIHFSKEPDGPNYPKNYKGLSQCIGCPSFQQLQTRLSDTVNITETTRGISGLSVLDSKFPMGYFGWQ